MQFIKALVYISLPVVIFLTMPIVLGSKEELKTFGISGTVLFENTMAKGTRVVLTTLDENPFDGIHSEKLYVDQYLLNDGQFYRRLNAGSGSEVFIWIKRVGYPAFKITRVLSVDQVNFGEVNIPAKLDQSNETPVAFYKEPCKEAPLAVVAPSDIKVVKELVAVKCEENGTVEFQATIELSPYSDKDVSDLSDSNASTIVSITPLEKEESVLF